MKIALIRLSAMGDIIQTATVLPFIKKKVPEAEIYWIVDTRFQALLEENPFIDYLISIPLKGASFKELLLIRKELHALPFFDAIVDFQGLLKSSLVSACLKGKVHGYDTSGVRERLSTLFYDQKYPIPYHENVIERYLGLVGSALGFSLTDEEIRNKESHLGFKESSITESLSKEYPNVLFVMGATLPVRRYPKEKWVEVISELSIQPLLLWGSLEEKERALWIQEKCPRARLVPKLSFNDLKALVAHIDLVVGNDSGPSHLAWAFNKPSLILFGPTPAYRNTYQTHQNRVIDTPSFVNPYKINPQDDSIQSLNPKEIAKVAKELLQIQSTRHR